VDRHSQVRVAGESKMESLYQIASTFETQGEVIRGCGRTVDM
jgi:hypothetical protein